MQLAFYNGRAHGTWLDRLIAAHDRGPFSHVELVFGRPGASGRSLCFSSSWRDGGVRFRHIDLADAAGKWTLVAVRLDDEAPLRAWCTRRLGGRYDIPGVLAFKLPLVRQRLNWWFCSEICVAALQQAGLFAGAIPHRTSPNSLYRLALGLEGAVTYA